jgi:hypothetical protein
MQRQTTPTLQERNALRLTLNDMPMPTVQTQTHSSLCHCVECTGVGNTPPIFLAGTIARPAGDTTSIVHSAIYPARIVSQPAGNVPPYPSASSIPLLVNETILLMSQYVLRLRRRRHAYETSMRYRASGSQVAFQATSIIDRPPRCVVTPVPYP